MGASRALIVNYHYCAPPAEAVPGLRGVTPEAMDRQFAALAARFTPLDARAFPIAPAADGPTGCLVTFDDGCRQVLDHALPLVTRHGLGAMVFVCSEPYVDKRVLNVQKSHLLQGRWGWDGFRRRFLAALDDDPDGGVREDASGLGLERMYRYDDADTAAFKRLLNVELPYAVAGRVLDRLFEAELGSQADAVAALYLSLDDVRRCADAGLAIGLHTRSHCMLSRLDADGQAREFDEPLHLFRDRMGLEVDAVSYPYGIRGAWNGVTKTLAAARGLSAGFTLGRAVYDPGLHTDRYEIPRFDVNDVFDGAGRLGLPA